MQCVVMELDQWYLKYGEEEWRGAVEAWLHNPRFNPYSASTLNTFEGVVAWLKEWACSRRCVTAPPLRTMRHATYSSHPLLPHPSSPVGAAALAWGHGCRGMGSS